MVTFRLHEITIDCADPATVADFWAALLGGELHEPLPGWRRLTSTEAAHPLLNFQPVAEPKRGKSRVHLDLVTEDLEGAIARVCDLGGRATGELHRYDEGTVAVLADPEGTEFCVVAFAEAP